METSTLRMRALSGTPLADARTRDTVLAVARAIAERTGVTVRELSAQPDSLTVTLETGKLAALGFLAELRRNTNTWFAAKHQGQSLWGEPAHDE